MNYYGTEKMIASEVRPEEGRVDRLKLRKKGR